MKQVSDGVRTDIVQSSDLRSTSFTRMPEELRGIVDMEASSGSFEDWEAAHAAELEQYSLRLDQVHATRKALSESGLTNEEILKRAPIPSLEDFLK